MLSHKPGFTLAEMLISVAIIGLLAVIAVVNLNAARQNEELRAAANQLVADIRSMQSRALAAGEVKSCLNAGSNLVTCELSTSVCIVPADCDGAVPASFGIHASTTDVGYVSFAEVQLAAADYQYSGTSEMLTGRSLLQGSLQNVIIDQVYSDKPVPGTPVVFGDISFTRQNGMARMYDGGVVEPDVITIHLKHKLSDKTKDIVVNRITGRVSMEN